MGLDKLLSGYSNQDRKVKRNVTIGNLKFTKKKFQIFFLNLNIINRLNDCLKLVKHRKK